MAKRIFTLTYGGGHVTIMIPLYRALRARSDIDLTVLGLSIAQPALRQAGIEYRTLTDYRELLLDARAERFGRELAARWHTEGKGLDYAESVAYAGIAMRDLVDEMGEAAAREKVAALGRPALLPVASLRTLLQSERPDLLLTGSCPRYEHAAVIAAQELGIPVFSISDYLGFVVNYAFTGDRLGAICEIARENLVTAGTPADRIVVTGSPAFDPIIRELREWDAAILAAKHGLEPGRAYVTLGMHGNMGDPLRVIEVVSEALRPQREVQILVKPHPGDDPAVYRAFFAARGEALGNVRLVDGNIREFIFLSTVLVTFYSTCGLEAVLMDKPLLQLNITGRTNPYPLYRYGLSLQATDAAETAAAYARMISDAAWRQEFAANRDHYLRDILMAQGTGRCLRVIDELLAKTG